MQPAGRGRGTPDRRTDSRRPDGGYPGGEQTGSGDSARSATAPTPSRRTVSDDPHGVVVDCAVYEQGNRRSGRLRLDEALAAARGSEGFVWIGLHEPTEGEFADIAAEFSLPELAVEDAVMAHQRPKLDVYDDVVFVVLKPVRYVDHDEVVEVSELAVFVGAEFVITVRHGHSDVGVTARADLEAKPELLQHGPGAVLYRLADLIVDEYGEVVDAIAVDVDEIETQVFSADEKDHAQRIYKLKREVLTFRRAVAPLAQPLQRLTAGEVPRISPEAVPYFRDVHDHVLRAADAIEGYDRLLSDVLSADLAQVSVRQNRTAVQQNEDTRRISAYAAIGLVPTAIAGIYGMNFDNMPELHWEYGYFLVLAVIILSCAGLYVLFRRNDWL